MIVYDSGDYHLAFLFRLQGSAFPKAALFGLPSTALAVLFSMLLDKSPEVQFLKQLDRSSVWSASILVVGLLLAFRTNKAYDRFWEGTTLVQQMRAEWFEAASNLMAFSEITRKRDPTNVRISNAVNDFQGTLIRLMSLMHGAALRQIGGYMEEFPVLDIDGLDDTSLEYLAGCEEKESNRVEVLLHWIQVLITDNHTYGIVSVPPPILTRAYQTLSRGMVNLHNARKLADVPFPFPLSQAVVVLVLIQSFLTPAFAASAVEHPALAAVITFLPVFGMWCCVFISGQLEQPFGTDSNDLPLSTLQFDMNASLLMLLEAKKPPCLNKNAVRTVTGLRKTLGNMQSSSTDAVDFRRGLSKELGARVSGRHSGHQQLLDKRVEYFARKAGSGDGSVGELSSSLSVSGFTCDHRLRDESRKMTRISSNRSSNASQESVSSRLSGQSHHVSFGNAEDFEPVSEGPELVKEDQRVRLVDEEPLPESLNDSSQEFLSEKENRWQVTLPGPPVDLPRSDSSPTVLQQAAFDLPMCDSSPLELKRPPLDLPLCDENGGLMFPPPDLHMYDDSSPLELKHPALPLPICEGSSPLVLKHPRFDLSTYDPLPLMLKPPRRDLQTHDSSPEALKHLPMCDSSQEGLKHL